MASDQDIFHPYQVGDLLEEEQTDGSTAVYRVSEITPQGISLVQVHGGALLRLETIRRNGRDLTGECREPVDFPPALLRPLRKVRLRKDNTFRLRQKGTPLKLCRTTATGRPYVFTVIW